MIQAWRLDCGGQTLVLATPGAPTPEAIYWGAALPENEDLAALYEATRLDRTGGHFNRDLLVSLCPLLSEGFQGQPGLVVANELGAPLLPDLRFKSCEARAEQLTFQCVDAELELTLTFTFHAHGQSGVISARSELNSKTPVHVHWLAAPVLQASQASEEMIDFSGRWTGEFQPMHVPWSAGSHMREARTGRSGPEHFPALIVPDRGATQTSGQAFGFTYGWSGGHRMIAEELPDGRRVVQFGHSAGSRLQPTTAAQTAPLYLAWSNEGLNGIGKCFQRHARDVLVSWPDQSLPRPVHYNSWEAVYFDHDPDQLKNLADRAAALGAERFVLDDGWFGLRDDDTTSLGDWGIDRRKWPDDLTPLISHVLSLGMSFGLWVEPEMVNPDSNLARSHPDWILGPADQPIERHQMVLNLTLQPVQEFIVDMVSDLLTRHEISYLKWDHNRLLPVVDAAQTESFYAILERLRNAYPEVEIESCASGGGRIDFGVLEYTQRVWLSDSNDALERLRMQSTAALFLPAAITGSHVGPRRCHTSGRELPMAFRAWVASMRHMGFEMDLNELTADEAETLAEITKWWKSNRDWRMSSDILGLDTGDPSITAEIQLSQNGDRFVVFVVQGTALAQMVPRPLRLTGLRDTAKYELQLVNPEDRPRVSRGNVALVEGPVILSGQALMNRGISIPLGFPATMWVIEGRLVE